MKTLILSPFRGLGFFLLLTFFACKKDEPEKVEITITSNIDFFTYKITDLSTNQTIISDVFDSKYLQNKIDYKQIKKGNYKIQAKSTFGDLELNFTADRTTNNIYLNFN